MILQSCIPVGLHYKETALVLGKYMLRFPVLYSYNMHLLHHVQQISSLGSAHIHHGTLTRALVSVSLHVLIKGH